MKTRSSDSQKLNVTFVEKAVPSMILPSYFTRSVSARKCGCGEPLRSEKLRFSSGSKP